MSNNQLHTPGPWEFTEGAIVGPKIDDKPVWLRPVVARLETGVSKANARLIAAAPTMAEYIERRAVAGDAEAAKIMEAIHA